jgi:hypothetical protein
MTSREEAEYIALRATIRERGSVRVCVFAAGLAAWSAAAIATAALASTPVATLLPLLLLASIFEAVFALHVGVERIGRYIQVFHETDGSGWEHAAMAFGRPAGVATTDALFVVPFLIAALFNIMPALLFEPARVELVFIGGGHALFVLRLVVARYAASKQREIDLARFAELRTRNSQLGTRS